MPARKHTRNSHQDIGSTFHLSSLFFQRFQGQQSRYGGGEGGRNPWDLDVCDLQQLHILGVHCAVWRAGDQSLLPMTDGLGTLERGGYKAGGAERWRYSQLYPSQWARSCYPCSSAERMGVPRGEACPLSPALPGRCLMPCQPPARPQNPPRAHRPCSTSPPSIWFIWGGGRKSKG